LNSDSKVNGQGRIIGGFEAKPGEFVQKYPCFELL